MNVLRRHWYDVGLVLGALALARAFLGHTTNLQFIFLLNFAVLTVHQFEEYGWPGGFPWIMNEVVQTPSRRPDRYLLNQNSALFVNVPLAWTFYLAPVFFPNITWIGLASILFGFGQFGFHGIFANVKLKSFYNPGLVAVVFGHIPIGVWYFFEIGQHLTLWDWAYASGCLIFFIGVGMQLIAFRLLADRNSPYPFAPEELERFDRKKHLVRLGRI